MTDPVLEIKNLSASFAIEGRKVNVVRDVSFTVARGSTVALVGESGCGKSVTALSILGLISDPPGRIDGGQIMFGGKDLRTLGEAKLRQVRGNRIAMIFQEPLTSLNPIYTVGAQIAEAIRLHERLSRTAIRARTLELLAAVGIPAPEQRMQAYPHQLSGGMRQRVMIAMALACSPDLLIADEPTTALDATIQSQILELLANLKRQFQMSILLITHDLGIVAEHAETIVVMYAGRVVETGPVTDVFHAPKHPYTAGLLASIPARTLGAASRVPTRRLPTIDGVVPTPGQFASGCRFADRCAQLSVDGTSRSRCKSAEPGMSPVGKQRWARCHFPLEAPHATR